MFGINRPGSYSYPEGKEEQRGWRESLKNVPLVFLVISLLLTVAIPAPVEEWQFHEIQVGHLLREFKTALLIGALLAFTLDRISREEQLRTFRHHLLTLEAVIARGIKTIGGGTKILRFLDDMEQSKAPPVAKEVARRMYSEYLEGIKPIDDGFSVTSVNWALRSNSLFYDVIMSYEARDLEIRVTHVGPPDEWLDQSAREALEAQRSVIAAGKGIITRIFIGSISAAQAADDLKYREVMDIMCRHGISTGYVQREDPRSVADVTWIPQIGILMSWKVEGGLAIDAVEIQDVGSRAPNLDRLWQQLICDAGAIRPPKIRQ